MRRLYLISLLLSFLPLVQAAWADNVVVFSETFDNTTGTGGNDNNFTGNIAQNTIKYDGEAWTGVASCGGAKHCLKFGSSSATGTATTPAINLSGTQLAVLTFSAAGWGDTSKNKLTVSVSNNGTITGDTDITLENGNWNDYRCIITGTSSFTITFSGKRGFLDNVVVTNITSVDAPAMTETCTFWQNTTETPSKNISIIPSLGTTVRYTTDGSAPTTTNGTEVDMATNFTVHATTTVKAIAYVGSETSPVVSKTYTLGSTTVNGIAAFKALANGTEARIYLADGDNARVLHAHNNKMYLRDNSGTICLDFGTTATFNPAPVHNQHVAGWIVGQKQYDKGMLSLVATENTNTHYLALAAPVTEPATQPTVVDDYYDLSEHVGDWVQVKDVRQSSGNPVTDEFGCEQATSAYEGALMDVSAIALSSSKLAPVYYNGITPVVYVLDEDLEFVSPNADLENVTVRLKRTLSKDYWNTLTLPFDLSTFDGEIRMYSDQSGNTMIFSDEPNTEAGKPYLVKPTEDIVNPEYKGVTLSATAAQNIEQPGGNIAFVGTYSPTDLDTDKTMMFLKSDGKLYFPTNSGARLKGMRAYFRVPQGVEARLFLGDGDIATGIGLIDNGQLTMGNSWYTLDGRRLDRKPTQKGVYIVNGKKVVIK